MSIAEKLVTIAENQQKVYNAGASDFGLKGKGQGELVTLENVHPIEHKVEVGLSSKNLFDISKIESTAVITNNNDGTITISGTYSARTGKTLGELCPTLKVGDTVVFQVETTGNPLIYLSGSNYTWNTGGSKTITEADLNSVVVLYGKSDSGTYTISNIQIEYGTPTAYAPFVADFSDCKVKAIGKNLFDKTDYIRHSDGTIGFSVKNLVEGETYTISTNIPIKQFKVSNAPWGYSSGSANNDDGFDYHTWKHTRVEQISESATLYIHFILVGETSMVSDISQLDGYEIQIEYGTTPTEYTEYIEPTEYTANADGTVEGVKSISPVMNLTTDKAGVIITADYFIDVDRALNELTTAVALSGGE